MRAIIARVLMLVGVAAAGGCAALVQPLPGESLPPVDEFTVAATGDFIVQPQLAAAAAADARAENLGGYAFSRIMDSLSDTVHAADLGICHWEVPVARRGDPITDFPTFNAPPELITAAVDLGYDACSTASNHILDYGMDGVTRTLSGLEKAGIRHAGSARTRAEAMMPTVLNVRGVRVGHLSYTFSFNGIERPAGQEWIANLIDPKAILAEARRAKSAGAEVVIVSLQWGTEYQHEPDIGQLGLARELLAAPEIDLIIGHHVHVVQPFEKIGEKWVAYGISNVMTRFPDGSPEDTQDALVATFTFSRTPDGWRVTRVEARPTWMEYQPRPRIVDLPDAFADPTITDEQRAAYRRAHDRIVRWIEARGAARDGLVISGN